MNVCCCGHILVALLKYVYSELRRSWSWVTTTVLLLLTPVWHALHDDGCS
jgi:hypothetical protein